MAPPSLHIWTDQRPRRRLEPARAKGNPNRQALCCDGVWRTDRAQTLLHWIEGRPVNPRTTAFLAWLAQPMAAEQKRVLVLIWDNASWHGSREVRTWSRAHHQQAKRHGGVRLFTWRLPSQSPWLNPIEPHWVHGKRAVVEPARLLTAPEIITRLCEYFGCAPIEHLKQPFV